MDEEQVNHVLSTCMSFALPSPMLSLSMTNPSNQTAVLVERGADCSLISLSLPLSMINQSNQTAVLVERGADCSLISLSLSLSMIDLSNQTAVLVGRGADCSLFSLSLSFNDPLPLAFILSSQSDEYLFLA